MATLSIMRRALPGALLLPLTLVACQRERPGAQESHRATNPAVATSNRPQTAGTNASPTPTLSTSNHPDSAPKEWSREAFAQRTVPTDGPRLYAKTRHVWIYGEPDASKQWIGYLWTGGSVRLRDTKPRYGIACNTFYAIEPRGYVCADGDRVTTDPKDPVVVATFPYSPRTDAPFPHRYGESRGAPLYLKLPTEQEQRYREGDLTAHLRHVSSAREGHERHPSLLDVDLTPAPEGPFELPKLAPSVHEAHGELKTRSTVAYSAEVRFLGRDFLLTSDYRFIPKDRVAVYPKSTFAGVRLNEQIRLPLAWFRDARVPKVKRHPEGGFTVLDESFERLTYVMLTGKREVDGGTAYLETRDGFWVKEANAVVPKLAAKTPWDAEVGHADESPMRPKGRATWIEVSLLEGWLLAYEGTRPVFTTLISPGKGGLPRAGHDPLENSATPLGRFSITGKFISSTMVAPHDYIHSEVPFAQNFTGPYALHSAYWHDRWGHLMSGGCINLSPIDALYLFQWTEPQAPPGWYGTRWLPYLEPATTLLVHR
jgi:hypothetical protein